MYEPDPFDLPLPCCGACACCGHEYDCGQRMMCCEVDTCYEYFAAEDGCDNGHKQSWED